MIIDAEVYIDHEVEDFLDHHGVKGQKWGIRNDIKKVSSGIKKASKFVGRHPKGTVFVLAGAAAAAQILTHTPNMGISKVSKVSKSAEMGQQWMTGRFNPDVHSLGKFNPTVASLGKFNPSIGLN
jgi:hypothetical protein